MIFVFVHDGHDDAIGGTAHLQHLQAVCKHWKTTAEGHPQLKRCFNTIHLKPSTIREDLPFVESYLRRKASMANAMHADEKDAAAEMVTLCICCGVGEGSSIKPFFTLRGLDAISKIKLGSSAIPWPCETQPHLISQLMRLRPCHPFLDKISYLSISITCRVESFEVINSLPQLDTLVLSLLDFPFTFTDHGPPIVLPRVRRLAVFTCGSLPGVIFDCPALEYLECHGTSLALFEPQSSVPKMHTFRHEGRIPSLESWITQLSDTPQRIEFVMTGNVPLATNLSKKIEQVYLQHVPCDDAGWIERCEVKKLALHEVKFGFDLNALDGIDVVHQQEPLVGLILREWNIDPDEL